MIFIYKLDNETRKKLEDKINIVGLSGGKDSVATCILLRHLDIPFKTVTAEVWWKENITGENPLHFDFLHSKLFPKLESWGIEHEIIKSDITAFQYMTTKISKSQYPDRIGKYRGFPLCGKCGIQRDCKLRPINQFYKSINVDYNSILGFGNNEKERIYRQGNKSFSLLSLLGIHEQETFKIDSGEGLLSPVYNFTERNGCWFCPNQKIQELEFLYRNFPEYWNELMYVQNLENKISELFNRTQTLYDIEKQILTGVQMKFFTGGFFL